MNRSSPYTVTGPVSSVESVGFLNRTARNAKFVVAALALGVVEVDDLAVGLAAHHRHHRASRRCSTVIGVGFAKWLSPTGCASTSRGLAARDLRLLPLRATAPARPGARARALPGSTFVDDLDARRRDALIDQLVAHDVRAVVRARARSSPSRFASA